MLYKNESRLSAIRDSDGNLIQSTIDSKTSESETYTYGMRLDLTDDYIDPRRGIRAETSLWHTPPSDDDSPDFDIIELNLTGYIPMGSRNTLAMNYFQADTLVDRQGQTDPALVEADLWPGLQHRFRTGPGGLPELSSTIELQKTPLVLWVRLAVSAGCALTRKTALKAPTQDLSVWNFAGTL